MAALPPPPPSSIEDIIETQSFVDRQTRGGPRFFYELNVLQQPERARACGSGQKSAADRRPVDPPPVVQLKVRKGMTKEDAKDVTMAYNGNFFLFAELAPARVIANGRVQTPAAVRPGDTPVLTGMPVSGMAYLDRPSEAGYFLFPDLSVRHEGRYVLAFHLYEEIKNPEDRDMASDPSDDDYPCFNWRMAVKSVPFSVFSAKKFPGLTESTNLSKTISEQGCRVRIRRDVRMRRREGKPSGGNDFESNADNNEYRSSRRTQTPEIRSNADQYRARSTSNSSEHRAAYPPAPPERRPSAVESFQPPPPPPPPPHAAAAPPPNTGYLSRFSATSNAPYPPQQHPQPMPQPPPVSPSTPYYSAQPSPYQQAPMHYSSRPSSQYAPSNPPPTPHDSYDRRGSMMALPSPSHYAPREMDYGRRESDARRDSLQSYRMPPPVESHNMPRQSVVLPPISTVQMTAPPPPPRALLVPSDVIEPAPATQQVPVPDNVHAGMKRGYADTFAESSRPLYDGQRPQDMHSAYNPHRDFSNRMAYKRADGTYGEKPNNEYRD
ncbi:sexual development activator [Colletotrichum karsti]|uniref:Sexual development activator n=1 Tax=Colletotrichum karsti TaxID=1095194 RepID=A0A9P6I994_9PEZI|nr:sexual development activator [Colletotrichum karsti]KAF9878584.1 sexual development activator [Colletotrichum karsti]